MKDTVYMYMYIYIYTRNYIYIPENIYIYIYYRDWVILEQGTISQGNSLDLFFMKGISSGSKKSHGKQVVEVVNNFTDVLL